MPYTKAEYKRRKVKCVSSTELYRMPLFKLFWFMDKERRSEEVQRISKVWQTRKEWLSLTAFNMLLTLVLFGILMNFLR